MTKRRHVRCSRTSSRARTSRVDSALWPFWSSVASRLQSPSCAAHRKLSVASVARGRLRARAVAAAVAVTAPTAAASVSLQLLLDLAGIGQRVLTPVVIYGSCTIPRKFINEARCYISYVFEFVARVYGRSTCYDYQCTRILYVYCKPVFLQN